VYFSQLELDSLRTLCYADADVFLLCFNVACPDSFDAVTSRWLPEIRRLCPSTPIVLVGTQSDRRLQLGLDESNSTAKKGAKLLVSERQAERLADRIGAATYIECSASEQTKVKDVFDAAIVVTLDRRGLVKCRQSKKGGGLKKGRGFDVENGDCKLPLTAGKSPEYNGRVSEFTDEQKRRQQRRHRWKQLLCCCRRQCD
jgi:Ras family